MSEFTYGENEEEFEIEHDKQTAADFEAISIMIKRAEKEGLLAEVIWSYGSALDIPSRCAYALGEWDV